jgi:hypothetical protein
MAADVVPVLNEKIQTSFHANMMKDRRITQISNRIRDGTATFYDGHDYAERLGENLSKALRSNLNAEMLPDGRLYYNIAQRTVTPALMENYELTNDVAEQIQSLIDAKQGIGLKSVKADFPKARIQGLIYKMTTDGISLEDALVWLGEPIINNSEAFFDDFIDSNAKFRAKAGLETKLIRRAESGACEWCRALEGTFPYGEAPENIYRRHEYCRCSVVYVSEKGAQGVWTKKNVYFDSKSDRDKRIEQALKFENQFILEREKVIRYYKDQTGYTRRTAVEATRNKYTIEDVQPTLIAALKRQKRISKYRVTATERLNELEKAMEERQKALRR